MPQIGPELASIISDATSKLDEWARDHRGNLLGLDQQTREIANEVAYSRTMHHETVIALLSENMWLGTTEPETDEVLAPFDAARAVVCKEVEDALSRHYGEIVDEWTIGAEEDDGERESSKEEEYENMMFESGGVFEGYERDSED